jgi:hypothetical protein
MESTDKEGRFKMKATCSNCGSVNLFDGTASNPTVGPWVHVIDPGQQVSTDKPCRVCHKKGGLFTTTGQIINFWRGKMQGVNDSDSVWVIRFRGGVIESQETGETGSHTIGKIFFDVTDGLDARNVTYDIPGIHKEFECVIRHAAGPGPKFEDAGFEVEVPEELKKHVNFSEFQETFENYYYQVFEEDGSFASAFVQGLGGANVITEVKNSRFQHQAITSIKKTNKKSKGAW